MSESRPNSLGANSAVLASSQTMAAPRVALTAAEYDGQSNAAHPRTASPMASLKRSNDVIAVLRVVVMDEPYAGGVTICPRPAIMREEAVQVSSGETME